MPTCSVSRLALPCFEFPGFSRSLPRSWGRDAGLSFQPRPSWPLSSETTLLPRFPCLLQASQFLPSLGWAGIISSSSRTHSSPSSPARACLPWEESPAQAHDVPRSGKRASLRGVHMAIWTKFCSLLRSQMWWSRDSSTHQRSQEAS